MSDVTQILERLRGGEPDAAADLLTEVYAELKRMASYQAAQQPPGATLNPTALVHEAWMRLAPNRQMPAWNSRGHFFSAAAEAMRRIVIDAARRRNAAKRCGEGQRLDLEAVEPAEKSCEELLELDEALQRLETEKPEVVRLIKLRYFVGLKNDEAAEILGISPRTAKSWWAYGKAWLHAALADS